MPKSRANFGFGGGHVGTFAYRPKSKATPAMCFNLFERSGGRWRAVSMNGYPWDDIVIKLGPNVMVSQLDEFYMARGRDGVVRIGVKRGMKMPDEAIATLAADEVHLE